MPDFNDVNNPGGASPTGGSDYGSGAYDAASAHYEEPTTGSDSWDNSADASTGDGFADESPDGDEENAEGEPSEDFDDPDNQYSETDENEDGDETDADGNARTGGQAGRGKELAPVPYSRFQEKVTEANSWREPARQYGIQDPGQLPELFEELAEWRRLAKEEGNFASPHDVRAAIEARNAESRFVQPLENAVAEGRMDQDVADHLTSFFRESILPELQQARAAKPLIERIEQQEARTRFDGYIASLKVQFPSMDETAVVNAARAGGDAQAEAERTHQRYIRQQKADRQRAAARGGSPGNGQGNGQGEGRRLPRVETRSGGGSASRDAAPDPRDYKAWDAYHERKLKESLAARNGR